METESTKRTRFEATMPDIGDESPQTPKIQQAPTKAANFLPEVKVMATELPSRGVAYPKGAWITHRPYMFGEVKKISQSKLTDESSYDYILEGVECSFDKYNLTVPDALYVGLLRKISTLGTSEIIARYEKCGKCGKPGHIIFKTTDIEFEDMNIPKLPIVVDMAIGEVHFSPMTVKNYLGMVKRGKEQDEVSLYAVQATNLKYDEAYKAFYNASPEDAQTLLEVDKYLFHSIKPLIKKCGNLISPDEICGNPIKIELDGGQALLLPFRRDQGTAKAKIRFGLENER